MKNKKNIDFTFFVIAIVVAIFFVIGLFVTIERRWRIFEKWKKKINKIRELRRKLAGLYELKARCDKRANVILWIGRTWLVVVVIAVAQLLHYKYGPVWYLSLSYSFMLVGVFYKGFMFWWFASKYGTTEAMQYIENKVQYRIYRANDLDPVTIRKIEEQIIKLEAEAMTLKLELRPEAQRNR